MGHKNHHISILWGVMLIIVLHMGWSDAIQMQQTDFESIQRLRAVSPVLEQYWPLDRVQDCTAPGITCSNSTGYIIQVDLNDIRLRINIDYFYNFSTSLQRLNLDATEVFGTLSPQLPTIYPNLRDLVLQFNELSGIIPPEFGNFRFLSNFNIRKNFIENPIPETLGNLTTLRWINLSGNRFTCPFPLGLAAAFEQMPLLSVAELASNALSTDSITPCLDRPYKKLSVLPFISADVSVPATTPTFSFNSSRVLIEVYHNRVFVFARNNLTGVPERREFLLFQIQGVQYTQSFQIRTSPRVVFEQLFDAFESVSFDSTTKEIRLRSTIRSGGTIDFSIILDPTVLGPEKSMKFSAYVADLNYTGFNRSEIATVLFPISVMSKFPHTAPNATIYCRQGNLTLGFTGFCNGALANISLDTGLAADISGRVIFGLFFRQITQRLNIFQVWPSEAEMDGQILAPGFIKFHSSYFPYGLEEYYSYLLRNNRLTTFYPVETQGVGRVFSMEFPGAFDRMSYDPDIQMSLIFGGSGGVQAPFAAQNSTDDATLRDPGVTAGIAIGVIVFVGLLVLGAIFVRRRQLRQQDEATQALRSKLGSATSEPAPTPRKIEAEEAPSNSTTRWSRAKIDRTPLTNA